MDLKEFKARATKEVYNTNNGWGFGGSSGTKYSLEGKVLNIGKWSYRHAPSESFTVYSINGESVSKPEFLNSLIE